jgi:ribosomal protein S18 acetylase RimI-like enzyme
VLSSLVEKVLKAVAALQRKENRLEGWRDKFAADPTSRPPPLPSRLQTKGASDSSSFESQALSTNAAFVGRLKPRLQTQPRTNPCAPPRQRDDQQARRGRAKVEYVFGERVGVRDVQVVGSRAEIDFLVTYGGAGSMQGGASREVTGALEHACVVQFHPNTGKAYLIYRVLEKMAQPLTVVDLPPLTVPSGVHIVPWPVDRDEEIRIAKNIAFADHWGSTPTAPLHWDHSVRGYGARPDLSFVALDTDDRVVAHCLNKRYPSDDDTTGRSDGWIDNLGTLPEWRGKGVAAALVTHSLHAFTTAGFSHASIGVDSENPSGAAALYRRLGFGLHQRSITHEIALPDTRA